MKIAVCVLVLGLVVPCMAEADSEPAVQAVSFLPEGEAKGEIRNCLGGPGQDWHADWYAWNNLEPPEPNYLGITGKVLVHNAGVRAMLALRQEKPPAEDVLLLDLLCSQQQGASAQVETWAPVRYEKKIPEKMAGGYSQVIIFHDGRELVTLDVEDAH